MEEHLIEARILAMIMDEEPKEKIIKETTLDCDGDGSKARKLIVKVARECM